MPHSGNAPVPGPNLSLTVIKGFVISISMLKPNVVSAIWCFLFQSIRSIWRGGWHACEVGIMFALLQHEETTRREKVKVGGNYTIMGLPTGKFLHILGLSKHNCKHHT
jgi:hypothetical protein